MNPTLRKVIMAAAILAGVAVLAVAGIWFFIASQSAAALALRDHVARSIVGVVGAYLEPSLDYDTVELELPGTVRFTGARLTSADGVDVLDLDRLVITLAEIPVMGRPVQISRVEAEGGSINLIQDAEGNFRGLEPLIKPGVREGTADIPSDSRLSNVLRLEHISIADIALAYDDGSGSPPMRIEGFGADLAIAPDADNRPGWHTLRIDTGRSPGLTLDIEGSFHIDSLTAEIDRGACTIDLDESTTASLPPPIQELIRATEASGRANAGFAGTVPLQNITHASLGIDLNLDAFHIARGDYRLPIESFKGRIDLAHGAANMTEAVANTMGGHATISANTQLDREGMPMSARWSISGVSLGQALRASTPAGQAPELAGTLTGDGLIDAALDDPLATISGSGELHVRDGRLMVLPGIAELLHEFGLSEISGSSELNHRADAAFELTPTGVLVTNSEIVAGVIAGQATGTLGYDGSLNMLVNAGPLKRLQNALGAVGNILGKITDQLVKYRLSGTLDTPTVTVVPLGVGG